MSVHFRRLLACICLCFLWLGAVNASAVDYTPLSQEQLHTLLPSSTRHITSLAGEWERSTDGSEWKVVTLPRSETYTGRITYRRQLNLDPGMVGRYVWNLYFLGLADGAEITINDQYVGKFFGGMVPFMARIPERVLKAGTNTVQFVIFPASDNALRCRKQQLFGQRYYTGVVREVLLVGTPPVSIGDVRTKVELQNDGAHVIASTVLQSGNIEKMVVDSMQKALANGANLSLTAELHSPSDNSLVTSSTQQVRIARDRVIDIRFDMHVTNPELWTPQIPSLYNCIIRVSSGSQVIDDYTFPLGIVTVEEGNIAAQSLLSLNHKPLFVKSVDYVEEVNDIGATVSAGQFERDIQLLKTLGVNCIHTLFHAPHPYLAYLCSRNGIMIIADMPAYDLPGSVLGTDEVRARFQNVAERMISAYERCPALALWNIASGLQQDKQSTVEYLKSMSETFHNASSRPVSQLVRFRAKNIIGDKIDVMLFAEDRFSESQDALQSELSRLAKEANKPFALCFGKPLQPDNRNGYADPISEEAQARYILTCFRALRAAQAGGSLVWSLTDFQLNHSTMLTNTSGDYVCYCGLTNLNRDPRTAFAMYKAWLNEEKDPTLQAGTYSETNPGIFIIGGILLMLIMAFMVNRSRRFREYVLRSLIHPYNFYADIRDQRILSRAQTVTLAAIISCTIGIMFTTLLYHARMSTEAEYLLMLVFPQEGLKSIISRIAWSPDICIIVFSALSMIALTLCALLLRLVSVFVRGRIFFSDTYIITVWSAVPVILFLPFATVLFRALDFSSVLLWISIAAAVKMWILFRILRATSVVFDVNPIPVYSAAIIAIGGVVVSIGIVYNSSYSFFPYLKYFFATVL